MLLKKKISNGAELMPIEDKSDPFSFFFVVWVLSPSLRSYVLMITFYWFSIRSYPMASLNIIRMKNLVFTYFVTIILDYNLLQHFLSSDRSVLISLILDNVDSNLDWYFTASLIFSSWPSFSSVAPLSVILIKKKQVEVILICYIDLLNNA